MRVLVEGIHVPGGVLRVLPVEREAELLAGFDDSFLRFFGSKVLLFDGIELFLSLSICQFLQPGSLPGLLLLLAFELASDLVLLVSL